MANLFTSYKSLWKSVFKPPRHDYHFAMLGPERFNVGDSIIQRTNLTLTNKRGVSLECSFFSDVNAPSSRPCVVYLHGSGCSRIEALHYKNAVLANGFNYFCFDFTACGQSGGKYSSLGLNEQDDLEQVIDYLRKTLKVEKIALWGRSMGAVTAILYSIKHPSNIACLILDSPYADFKKLFEEQAKEKFFLASMISSSLYKMVRSTMLKKAEIDIDTLKPSDHIRKLSLPALFGASEDDVLVPSSHTKELYAEYTGTKNLLMFPGEHNCRRPDQWILEAISHLKKHMNMNSHYLAHSYSLPSSRILDSDSEASYSFRKTKEFSISTHELYQYKESVLSPTVGSSPNSNVFPQNSPVLSVNSFSPYFNDSQTKPRYHFSQSFTVPDKRDNQADKQGQQTARFASLTPSQYYINSGVHTRMQAGGQDNPSVNQQQYRESRSSMLPTSGGFSQETKIPLKDDVRKHIRFNSYAPESPRINEKNGYLLTSKEVNLTATSQENQTLVQKGVSKESKDGYTTVRIELNTVRSIGPNLKKFIENQPPQQQIDPTYPREIGHSSSMNYYPQQGNNIYSMYRPLSVTNLHGANTMRLYQTESGQTKNN